MINFDNLTEKVFTATQKQIDKFGPREAGSDACKDCADHLKTEMETFADSARTEDFKVHTGAFLG